jgi:hypothetical protein
VGSFLILILPGGLFYPSLGYPNKKEGHCFQRAECRIVEKTIALYNFSQI